MGPPRSQEEKESHLGQAASLLCGKANSEQLGDLSATERDHKLFIGDLVTLTTIIVTVHLLCVRGTETQSCGRHSVWSA